MGTGRYSRNPSAAHDTATHTTNICETYTLYDGENTLISGWYVVTGAVTNDARIVVSGDVNLILADGAELVAKNGVNVSVANNTPNSLTVWAQSDGEGMGGLTATQVDVSQYQSAIGGGTGQQGGTVVINGGTVTDTGNNYGIEAGDGSVTINGGTVTATGADGIYARCGITLGWTKPADSITASSFSSGDGVSIKAGQTFADARQNLYEGTLDTAALVAVRNKTLRPYIPTPGFKDPEGREIEDPGVIDWLSSNGYTQADIYDLGNDAAATDRLYECWLLNLNFKVQDEGAKFFKAEIGILISYEPEEWWEEPIDEPVDE